VRSQPKIMRTGKVRGCDNPRAFLTGFRETIEGNEKEGNDVIPSFPSCDGHSLRNARSRRSRPFDACHSLSSLLSFKAVVQVVCLMLSTVVAAENVCKLLSTEGVAIAVCFCCQLKLPSKLSVFCCQL
jgi:hypothetical protein